MRTMRGPIYVLTFLTTLAVLHIGDRITAGIVACHTEQLAQCPRAVG